MADATEIAALASDIKRSAETGKAVETELSTSQRIIARVTDGIYREPWAAFRELIANAYDADATRVVIETGAPEFRQVTVRDNGNGMRPETVAYVVKSIGGSSKRTSAGATYETASLSDPDLSPAGRPLIGKIGIGLFAVAQLTQHFQIITKAKGDKARTSATVLLHTHSEEQLKALPEGHRYSAGNVTIKSEIVPDSDVESHGTTIILYSLRPEIRRSLQSVMRWQATREIGPDGKPVRERPMFHIGVPSGAISENEPGLEPHLPWQPNDAEHLRFERLIQAAEVGSERTSRPASLEHFDEYLRMLWQLSLSLPLPYIDKHPFDKTGADGLHYLTVEQARSQALSVSIEAKESLRDHFGFVAGTLDPLKHFEVIIDGVHLKRPIVLPDHLRRPSRIQRPVMLIAKVQSAFSKAQLKRAGGNLSFEAYLYWNSKIVPKDTSGVLVRVRGASGTLFDQSFLRYQVSEQTRLRQITAEIYVNDGLDAAINIDRESFNYSHPHFLFLQRWLHRSLRLLVNRLKTLAEQDLQVERALLRKKREQQTVERAIAVWERKQGKDADAPIALNYASDLPREVAGVEVEDYCMRALEKCGQIDDLDVRLANDNDLRVRLVIATQDLLREAGYPEELLQTLDELPPQ